MKQHSAKIQPNEGKIDLKEVVIHVGLQFYLDEIVVIFVTSNRFY